jgi:two-component sensor histidine kinase
MDAPEARSALEEAVRRVGSIALVHETLSQAFEDAVDFDAVADQLAGMVAELGAQGATVRPRREGSFGTVPATVATPLAMVLTELLQNAVEHGFAGGRGEVTVTAERPSGRLRVAVEDDGRGLPPGFDVDASASLGLSIVRTLVESELEGRLRIGDLPSGGTRVSIDVPVPD